MTGKEVELLFRGGAGEIGGPYFLEIKLGGASIGIDCGLSSKGHSSDKPFVPDFEGLSSLEALLITHGHLDHVGAVPCLAKSVDLERDFAVYMTSPTSEFGRMHWQDTLRFAKKDGSIPPFSEEQEDLAESYIELIEPGEVFTAGKGRFKIQPVTAGHILGATGYLIETGRKRIFVTGDCSLYTYPLVESFDFSPFVKEGVDVLVMESTYAGRELPEFDDEVERFRKDITVFLKEGRRILIPVFTIDRGPKVYWFLKSFRFGFEKYIFIDGNAKRGFEIYNRYNSGMLPDTPRRFVGNNNIDRGSRVRRIFNRRFRKTKEEIRREVLGHKPSIIIASSGMMFENSASYGYAAELIEQKDSAIFLVGYQDPNSPGALLQNTSSGSKICWGGREMNLRAAVNSYSFTAHARECELVELITRLRPKVTVFAHGEPEYIRKFLEKYRTVLPGHKIIAKNGEAIKI